MAHRESPRRQPRERERERDRDRDRERDRERNRDRNRERDREKDQNRERRRSRQQEGGRTSRRNAPLSSQGTSGGLSADSLAKLNQINAKSARRAQEIPQKTKRKRRKEIVDEKPLIVKKQRREHKKKRRQREVSGALLEEGRARRLIGLRGGDREYRGVDTGKRKRRIWIAAGVVILLFSIIIPVAVVVSKKNSRGSSSSSTSGLSNNLNGQTPGDVPTAAKGTYLDPSTWLDTTDFNTTYTNDTAGGLPVMGLMTAWDDSKSANSKTPAVNTAWGAYTDTPARGVNLGGWLSLEPFITPSLFDYDPGLGIIDEWTLCTHLGPTAAASTLEKHYATFVTEQTFIDIAAAGLDHVRIPYSYWAVVTYDGDPYVFRTSWRYLLRAIEWARKHGLRINLDLHAIPGSQNGWNHSGRQGPIGWLNGTNGALNAQRSLDIHTRLATFFAQDRYQNIIAFYGLVNEPRMTALSVADVLDWTASAYQNVRNAGVKNAWIVFGDGFRGLAKWQGELQGYDNLVLDVHQYVIFNVAQIVYTHQEKVTYACTGWTQQTQQSMDVATGFGPTMFAEWSQADTDCATNLNNVGVGNRWTGTYNSGDPGTQVLTPTCPTSKQNNCECDDANADPSKYSNTYKEFLQMFAEAQMNSFEKGLGWFYWTWKTETATQWSYQGGLAAGILPKLAYQPDFNCSQTAPSFSGLAENF